MHELYTLKELPEDLPDKIEIDKIMLLRLIFARWEGRLWGGKSFGSEFLPLGLNLLLEVTAFHIFKAEDKGAVLEQRLWTKEEFHELNNVIVTFQLLEDRDFSKEMMRESLLKTCWVRALKLFQSDSLRMRELDRQLFSLPCLSGR
jgi:hypothetical protein